MKLWVDTAGLYFMPGRRSDEKNPTHFTPKHLALTV